MARERSRAYPAYGLKDAVEWAGAIQKNIGRGVFDRDMAAHSFGSAGGSGTVPRKVASMVQFGILDLQKGGYKLSNLGLKIVMPCNDAERKEAIVEAFGAPPLYKDVLARYAPEGCIPTQLPNILAREFRIAPPAAPSAVRVFLDSGRYAGVLNDEGEIIDGAGFRADESDSLPLDGVGVDEESCSTDSRGQSDTRPAPLRADSADQPMRAGQQIQELRLSKGTARLIVPEELSSRDIKLLQKMLEVWALQVELLKDGDEVPDS